MSESCEMTLCTVGLVMSHDMCAGHVMECLGAVSVELVQQKSACCDPANVCFFLHEPSQLRNGLKISNLLKELKSIGSNSLWT